MLLHKSALTLYTVGALHNMAASQNPVKAKLASSPWHSNLAQVCIRSDALTKNAQVIAFSPRMH